MKILIIMTLSISVFASQFEQYLNSHKNYSEVKDFMEKDIKKSAKKIIEDEVNKNHTYYSDFIKVWFPHLLPKEFPARTLYLGCYHFLHPFTKDLTNFSRYQDYYECLYLEFKGHIPENIEKALKHFKPARPQI